MAVDIVSAVRSEMSAHAQNGSTPMSEPYTAIAVFDGAHWTALVRELDIASEGDQAEEAIWSLKAAVREALAVAAERKISAGQPVPDDQLLEFMASHKSSDPVTIEQFTIN
jgi:hypothetical protein